MTRSDDTTTDEWILLLSVAGVHFPDPDSPIIASAEQKISILSPA